MATGSPAYVHADGLGADEQRLGDLAVAAPGRHQGEHLGLARWLLREGAGQ
jgi:hypothetical protein